MICTEMSHFHSLTYGCCIYSSGIKQLNIHENRLAFHSIIYMKCQALDQEIISLVPQISPPKNLTKPGQKCTPG